MRFAHLLASVYTERSTQQFAPPPTATSAPNITSLSKIQGQTGDLVTVKGNNLSGATVLFGGFQAIPVGTGSANSVTVKVPARSNTVNVTVSVVAQGGGSTTSAPVQFTYTDNVNAKTELQSQIDRELSLALLAAASGQPAGGSQSPTISATITFTIKATGTIGPSFALSRVSGGSASLFSLIRTDNNYVNLVLTPSTYCWTQLKLKENATCPSLPNIGPLGIFGIRPSIALARMQPGPVDVQTAVDRINTALVNLNLAHLLSP